MKANPPSSLRVATDTRANDAAPESAQYLTFSLDRAALAVAISQVVEIIEYRALTAVPMMPAFIGGVLNLRGAVVPVVDLRARFGRPPSEISRRTCIVIVELSSEEGRQNIGLMVDQVNAVIEMSGADIEPAPAFGSGLRPDFIAGVGKVGDKLIVILALDTLLSIDEMAQAVEASTTQEPDAGVAASDKATRP